jgi:hypothetical protein
MVIREQDPEIFWRFRKKTGPKRSLTLKIKIVLIHATKMSKVIMPLK